MWQLEPTEKYEVRHRRYEKKHPKELTAVLSNLATYHAALRAGSNPLQVKFGFVHSEGRGVIAIDQKGGGGKLAQTRLYLYPDVEDRVLYQLTLGDKNSQDEDIKYCHEFVERLRSQNAKDKDNDPAESQPTGGGQEQEKEVQQRPGDGPRPV